MRRFAFRGKIVRHCLYSGNVLIRCTKNRIREIASLLPTSPSQSQSAFFFAASVSETTPAQVLFSRTATVGNSISYSVIPIGFCHNHVINGGVPIPPQHRIRHLTLFFLVMLCFRNGFPTCCKNVFLWEQNSLRQRSASRQTQHTGDCCRHFSQKAHIHPSFQ